MISGGEGWDDPRVRCTLRRTEIVGMAGMNLIPYAVAMLDLVEPEFPISLHCLDL